VYNEVVKTDPPVNISPSPQVSLPGFVELTSGLEINAQIQPVRMELELPGGVRIKIY